MLKLVYKPMGMVVSVLGGLAASVVFKRVWKLVNGEDETPTATQRHRTWSEILVAALLQGAIFGLVKAVVDRAGAAGFERATGAWPGDEWQLVSGNGSAGSSPASSWRRPEETVELSSRAISASKPKET